jgi:hypothetical protein
MAERGLLSSRSPRWLLNPEAVELVSCSAAHRPADEQYARGEGLAGQAPGEPGTA